MHCLTVVYNVCNAIYSLLESLRSPENFSYDEEAESTCEKEVAAALALCPDSLDGLQTLASLRLSQVRKGDAAKIISSVFDRVRI